MTLVVLAIDALDPMLVDHFDCDYLALDGYGEMETFAYTKDQPLTPEVWATAATGLGPEHHGVSKAGTNTWDNPVIDFMSNYTWRLGFKARGILGDAATRLTGSEYTMAETESETVFDAPGRVVHDWPGVTGTEWLQSYWETANPGENGTTHGEFQRSVYGLSAQQFAWVRETLRHPSVLVATHTHLLDMTGHIYADDEAGLRRSYKWVDNQVLGILDDMAPEDELLILSDHGIVTEWSPDGDLDDGMHSWRAFSGSTIGGRPRSVHECRHWIENVVEHDTYDPGGEVDVPTEQLRDLGYFDQ